MGILSRVCNLISDEALWKVGDHKVKFSQVQIGTKMVMDGDPAYGGRLKEAPKYGRGFKCIDCKKKAESREELKDENCYEVINE